MILEEALKLMREGAKIRLPEMEPDEYYMGCYLGIIGLKESFEEKKKRGMSIVFMKGQLEHPKFLNRGKGAFYYINCPERNSHNYPQINLLFLMRDDWEIYNDN